MTQKTKLRDHYLSLRSALSPRRQQEGRDALFQALSEKTTGLVLSFVSFRSEIDTQALNQHLAKQGQLVLPRRENNSLSFYRVNNLEKGLLSTSFGLQEPIPALTEHIDPIQLSLILVPALSFDEEGFRLGYGMGSYDRILTSEQKTIGIGYLEQLHPTSLPRDPWDIPVSELLLF